MGGGRYTGASVAQYPAVIELSTLNGVNGFKLYGASSYDYDGWAVSLGDINGDGFADIVTGAIGADPHGSNSGAAYVVFGKASGFSAGFSLASLNGANGFRIAGEAMGQLAGASVAAGGDFNHDGFDDVIVGDPNGMPHGSDSGASYVVLGKSTGFAANLDVSGLNGSNGFKVSGNGSAYALGHSVAYADLNGDGFDDIILGGPGSHSGAPYIPGSVFVIFGHGAGLPDIDLTTPLNGTNGFRITGVTLNDYTGTSVASAGDVNGDGVDDLAIGTLRFGVGKTYIVFGQSGGGWGANLALSSLDGTNGFVISGEVSADFAGLSVSSAGDVNGDGIDDMLVGAARQSPHGAYSGAAYVVFGKNSGFPNEINLASLDGFSGFKISGVAAHDYSGEIVTAGGDVNGDGFDDLIVSAPRAAPHGAKSGAVYVVFGKASGFGADIDLSSLDGSNGFKLNGAAASDYTGFSVAGGRDINGDGLDDIVIGARHASANGNQSGETYVVFGALPTTAVTRTGTIASQHLVGGNLADALTGGGGNDKLYGNGGNDLLTGGSGNDYFNGGLGTDTVSYTSAAAGVHVSLLLNTAQNTVGAGTDTLISIEKLVGSAFADTLIANATGATLNGGPGGDDLYSGPGSDILNGGGAADFADYSLATTGVTVNLAIAGFQNTIGAGSDELVSIEKVVGSNFNDTITGDGGINTLFGQGGNDAINGGPDGDYLFGNAGNDTLNGQAGQDQLTGGAGNDVFAFSALADTAAAHPDTIVDFTSGQDKISLAAIDANSTVAGDQAFVIGAPGVAGHLVVTAYDMADNRTEIDLYVDNNASIDAAIWLTGNHAGLAAGDFTL